MSENELAQGKTRWHLWAVGVLALLWNAVGVFDFTATVTRFEPYMSQFSQELKVYWYGFPWWMFAVWGTAVWGGLAGAVLLLMKMRLAIAAFVISFACAVISMTVSLAVPGPEGSSNPVMAVVIIAIAAGLAYYAWRMRAGGVLR